MHERHNNDGMNFILDILKMYVSPVISTGLLLIRCLKPRSVALIVNKIVYKGPLEYSLCVPSFVANF